MSDIYINYTLLLLGAFGPLCGMGVASVIDNISKPLLGNDLKAVSRPEPMPFIKTATLVGPDFFVFSAKAAIILEAAKGVAFLGPLKPKEPADNQAMALPLASVIVIIVLLNVAFI